MTLSFHNVTPAPLAGVVNLNTDIWQRQCVFAPKQKYRVVAPSGKGKSTFVHCIYGLRFDYTGVIKINEQDVKQFTLNQWATYRQQEMAIVYQDLRLFLQLTGLENIDVKAVLYKNIARDKILKMAEALGISNLLHKKCNTLSYGERQRVAIMRALIQPFSLLLLDEPFSHLDRENSLRAAKLIEDEVDARGAGLIVTSLGQDGYFKNATEIYL